MVESIRGCTEEASPGRLWLQVPVSALIGLENPSVLSNINSRLTLMHLILLRPAAASTSSPGGGEQVKKPGGVLVSANNFWGPDHDLTMT